MKNWISMAMIAGMLLGVACAQVTSAAIPASDPDPTVVIDPDDLLRRSFDRMKSVRSFTADITADIVNEDETFTASASVALASNGDMAAQVALGEDAAPNSPAGGTSSMNWAIRIVESDLFFKVPIYGWYRVDLDEIEEDPDVPFSEPFDLDTLEELITPDAVPWHLLDVTALGSEEIGGVQTNRLGITADLVEVLRFFRDSDVWENIRTEAGIDQQPDHAADDARLEADLEEIQLSRWELWIDDDGLIRRLALDVEAGEMSAAIEIDLDDHDAAITVQPPSEYEDYAGGLDGGMFF